MLALSLVGALLVAEPPAAEDVLPADRVELHWHGPPGCDSPDAAREHLRAHLAQTGDPQAGEGIWAEVHVELTEDLARGRLRLRTVEGESTRELSAPSCDEIARAVALVIAMAVDPLLALEEDPTTVPAPEPVRRRQAPVIVARRAPATPEPRNPSRRRRVLRADLGASGGVGYGPIPAVSGVLDVHLGLRWRWLRVLATGTYWVPREQPIDEGSVIVQAFSAGLRMCGGRAFGIVEPIACVGAEAGAVVGRGRDLDRTATATRPWVGIVAGGGVGLRVAPRVAVFLLALGQVHVQRPTFHVQGLPGEVAQSPPVGGRGLLGIRVALP